MKQYSAPVAKPGATSRLSGTGRMIIGFLVSRKTIPLFIIIMLLSVIGSVHESVKQKSFVPVIIDVGGRLFNCDALLYHYATKAKPTFTFDEIEEKSQAFKEAEGGKERFFAWWEAIIARLSKYWDVIFFYVSILSSIYTFFMTYFIFVLMINKANTSAEYFSWIFAAIPFILIGALYGSFVYFAIDQAHCSISEKNTGLVEFGKAVNPIKGFYYTFTHLGEILAPFKAFVPKTPDYSNPKDIIPEGT